MPLGPPQRGIGVGGPVEAPERVPGDRDGHLRSLGVAAGLLFQVTQQGISLLRATGAGKCSPQHEPRAEAPARLDRGSRQALGQHQVESRQRLAGRALEQVAVAGPA